jgi:hypothetical protein
LRELTFYRICIVLPLFGLALMWALGKADFLLVTASATYTLTALILLVASVRLGERAFVACCNWAPLILALCFLLPAVAMGSYSALVASGDGASDFGFMLVMGLIGAFYSAVIGAVCLVAVKLLRLLLKAAGAIRVAPR